MAEEAGVTFLFDENMPHRLVAALRELGESVVHVYDVGLKNLPDELVLRYAGEREWFVVSRDQKILHRPHQRAVLKGMGMGAFFVDDSVNTLCDISRSIFRNWPDMKRLAAREERPFLRLVKHRSVVALRKRGLG